MLSIASPDAEAATEAELLAKTASAILPGRDSAHVARASDVRDFTQLLRAWVIDHHDLPGAQSDRIEKTHLLLRTMASATTIGEAMALLERFRRFVWGDRGARVTKEGDEALIILEQDPRPGLAGCGFLDDRAQQS